MHFAGALLQEIAAEGLEGVTLENLWKYLANEDSKFSLSIDQHTKHFIWKTLISMKCLHFYVNPRPDGYSGPFDRRMWLVDNDSGLFYEVPIGFQPRKFHSTDDPLEIGSCPFYTQRVDVTDEVRSSNRFHNLENVVSKWGDRLVIVASQKERQKLLLGDRCHPGDLSVGSYMILEAIARNRYNGLPTTNYDGLACCGLNGSSIWYARQRLEALGLVTSQVGLTYLNKSSNPCPLYAVFVLALSMQIPSTADCHWFAAPSLALFSSVPISEHDDFREDCHLSKTDAQTCLRWSTSESDTNYFVCLDEGLGNIDQPVLFRCDTSSLHHMYLGLSATGFKRTLHFAMRQDFVTADPMALKDCCSFLLGKPCSQLTEEDYHQFAKDNSLSRAFPSLAILLIRLKMDAAMNVNSWLANFGKEKRKPRDHRLDDSEFSSEEEADDEENVEDEFGDRDDQVDLQCPAPFVESSSLPTKDALPVVLSNPGTRSDVSTQSVVDSVAPEQSINDQTQSDPAPAPVTMRAFRRSLAKVPNVNAEDSLPVQFAYHLLPQETTLSSLLKRVQLNYFFGRRIVRAMELLGVVRGIKRSSEATFIVYWQFLTDDERAEFLKAERKSKGALKNVAALNVQTQRQKRRDFVLAYFEEHRVVPSVSQLRHLLWDHEESMGLKTKMDHKSLHRIIEELIKSKLIVVRCLKTIQGERRLLCHPNVAENDPCLATEVQSLDLTMIKKRMRTEQARAADRTLLNRDFKQFSEKAMDIVSMRLITCPRMRRRLLLHEYLFYTLFSLPLDAQPVIPATSTIPAIYYDEYSWRRFVAPLKPPEGMSRGWFSVNELVRSMPFGLYLHLVSMPAMPRIMCRWLGLNEALNKLSSEELARLDDQLMLGREQDVALSELFLFPLHSIQPPGGTMGRLANWLLSQRKLRSMLMLFEELTMHNLITLCDQKDGSDSDEPFLSSQILKVYGYYHRNASLLDTRYAGPGYRVLTNLAKCTFIQFHFETQKDVSSYWQTCEVICRNTPLGCRSMKGGVDAVEAISTVRPIMHTDKDKVIVHDDGSLPVVKWPKPQPTVVVEGHELSPCGACGLYPGDFTYLSRNWDRKPTKTREGDSTEESDQEADEQTTVPTIWTIRSTDHVPVHPEECFWQWSQRLFQDSEFQAGFDLHPGLARNRKGEYVSRYRRKQGFFTGSIRYDARQSGRTSSTKPGVEEQRDSDDTHPDAQLSDVDPSESTISEDPTTTRRQLKSLENRETGRLTRSQTNSTRVALNARKTLKPALKQKPRSRETSRFRFCYLSLPLPISVLFSGILNNDMVVSRAPRCVWSPSEDQLLVVCRVATLVIAGARLREYMCVPYTVIRDILNRYVPQDALPKTPFACARRLKFILFLKRSESLATHILLTRVSSRTELQKKYNYGWRRWHALCRDSAEVAERIFCEFVDRIIAEFVPRLSGTRAGPIVKNKQVISETLSPNDKTDLSPGSPNLTETQPNDPTTCDPNIRIEGSREQLEERFSFFSIDYQPDVRGIEDVGKNRAAVVVHTLYRYAMSSFRIMNEPTCLFRDIVFNRILRQYPRLQLNQALSLLFASRLITGIKFAKVCRVFVVAMLVLPEGEYRIFNTRRIKLTSRFRTWSFHEFHNQCKHVRQAQILFNKAHAQLQLQTASGATERKPLLTHSFRDRTNGGAVAFFLEMMLLEQSVTLQMDYKISDITFIPDRTIEEAIRRFECQTGKHDETTAADTGTEESMKRKAHKGSLNRSLLNQLQEAPACFGDPRFWIKSGYVRRLRWFDHHLSFSGGRLSLFYHPEAMAMGNADLRGLIKSSEQMEPVLRSAKSVIIRSLDTKHVPIGSSTPPPPSNTDVLEKFIAEGRFTGRTVEEIREHFGDNAEAAGTLGYLLSTKSVYWLGTTVSRFVHRRYIRLWLIHLKASSLSDPADHTDAAGTTSTEPTQPATDEPATKRV
ncbi:general transcription factor 3C polypeptide 1, partial [Paragonimus westermani]